MLAFAGPPSPATAAISSHQQGLHPLTQEAGIPTQAAGPAVVVTVVGGGGVDQVGGPSARAQRVVEKGFHNVGPLAVGWITTSQWRGCQVVVGIRFGSWLAFILEDFRWVSSPLPPSSVSLLGKNEVTIDNPSGPSKS